MLRRLTIQNRTPALLMMVGMLLAACVDIPEEIAPPDDDDDATEDLWDDPIFNTDDDDSADTVPSQVGSVSFSYNFDVTSDQYWDCQRSYRWIELPEAPAGGCADCLTTWRVQYQLSEDSCGPWGYDGDGYELSAGLDLAQNWLWFTHDEGVTWLRFFGQGSVINSAFIASWTFEDECIDMNSDGECDPGSELSYRELFTINP